MYNTYMANRTISLPDDVTPIIESLDVPFSTWVADQLRRHAAAQSALSLGQQLLADAALAGRERPTDEESRVPIKVAAATSNFMIGVTAIASLFVYFARGYVEPYAAVPVALGVVGGASIGAATSAKVHPVVLRRILIAVLLLVSVQMGLKAIGVDFGR